MNTVTAVLIHDQRMLELVKLLRGTGKVRSRHEFLNTIGMSKQQFRRINRGRQHFAAKHTGRVCAHFNVIANWLIDLEENKWRNR